MGGKREGERVGGKEKERVGGREEEEEDGCMGVGCVVVEGSRKFTYHVTHTFMYGGQRATA